MCEIEKSLSEIGKSPYEKLKLLYENEKLSCEIIITNRERKTTIRDLYQLLRMKNRCTRKKITIREYRLVLFLSR